jgi:hypothetical protein
LTTHGVWWTNQGAQKRFLQEFAHSRMLPEEEEKLRERAKEEVTKPVYGIGVVYYLDRTDRIQGVMLWGLPLSSSTTNENGIKGQLVEQIREILISNGSQAKSFEYFSEQSRKLVLAAFSDRFNQAQQEHRLDLSHFPKPLHRFDAFSFWCNTMRRRGHGAQKQY